MKLRMPSDNPTDCPFGTPVCTSCGEYVEVPLYENTGIGDYEYWGQKCTDECMAWVSDCCGHPIEEGVWEECIVCGMEVLPNEYNEENRTCTSCFKF